MTTEANFNARRDELLRARKAARAGDQWDDYRRRLLALRKPLDPGDPVKADAPDAPLVLDGGEIVEP